MKGKEITNHCLSTTNSIGLVYDTKWKGDMQIIKMLVNHFPTELQCLPKNPGTPGYRFRPMMA